MPCRYPLPYMPVPQQSLSLRKRVLSFVDFGESLELGAKLSLSPADGQSCELHPKCVDLDC
jgi:hypothetical protein